MDANDQTPAPSSHAYYLVADRAGGLSLAVQLAWIRTFLDVNGTLIRQCSDFRCTIMLVIDTAEAELGESLWVVPPDFLDVWNHWPISISALLE